MTDSGDVFAERLLQVIDEGQRTATYKLALLMALIDACADEAGPSGQAPTELHTRTIARHVVRIYLPQVRLFTVAGGPGLTLRQITNKESTVLAAVLRLHLDAEANGCRTFGAIQARLHDELEACLDRVEETFARYPLRLLQVVGKASRPFLYDVDWTDTVSLKRLHADGGGLVRFRPGAGDHLLRLAPLLRPLIELHWTRMVARLNRVAVEEEHLHRHLFGSSRISFHPALRAGLGEFQDGRCFYCRKPLGPRSEVDHFLPWSRWPNDAVENLVLADSCNNSKRDYLPALTNVERWTERFDHRAAAFRTAVADTGWPSEATRSLALARSCYAHVPAGTPLWLLPDRFTDDDPVLVVRHLESIRS